MRKIWIAISVLLLLAFISSPALAQPAVFFDDFDGDALLPHWGTPEPWVWDYNVSNSMLNVTDLHYPSSPKGGGNYAGMGASFAAQQDFQIDTRMGWGTTEGVQLFAFTMRFNSALLATIGYREAQTTGFPRQIYASAFGASLVSIPAPEPGIYDFRIRRTGNIFNFYFDGNLFASLNSSWSGSINGVNFNFVSDYPGPSGPFHIDRVVVVPAPGGLLCIVTAIALHKGKRRRDR